MSTDSYESANEEMFKRFLAINPDAATGLGLHDPYDMDLANGGFKRYKETLDLFLEWHRQATRAAKNEALTLDQKMGLKCLEMGIDVLKFSIDDYPMWKMSPDGLDIPGSLFFIMLTRDYAPYEQRAAAMSSRISQLPRYLEEFRARFRGARPVKLWTEIAIETCEEIPGFLKFISASSKGRVPDKLLSELNKNIAIADEELKEQLDWLNHLLDRAMVNFPMGKKKFEKLLRMRGLGMNSDQILALGEKYLAEFKQERTKIAARIAPGKSVEEAAKIIAGNCPKTFEQALKATVDEMEKAKKFIIENRIATITPGAILKVIETPAFMAPILPYAALFMPSKFDKVQEGAYIVTRPKDPRDLGKNLNFPAITNTAVHEAFPGHFHQGVRSNAKHWMLQLHLMVEEMDTVRVATETIEGWAHYCEKMMYDHGYEANDPAAYEMVNGAVWRAWRIIVDIKLARGEIALEDAVKSGMEEVGMTKDGALAEVKRYTKTPGQALSYMLGRHLIIEFRREMEKRLGPRFDELRFHDLVADYAYMPFHLMREAVAESMK